MVNEVHREFSDGEIVAGTRYRIVALIGAGGMGSVYDVEHVELGKRFVLKAMLRELAGRKDLVARLRQEWRALARLEHPNIVNVTDAGTSDTGVPFYVMERLDGETLAARLARTGPHARRRGARDRRGDPRRPERGARDRDRAPRRQAAEHLPGAGRRREAARLRHRQDRRRARRRDHRARDRHRHAALHVAGASARRARRWARRLVRGGPGAVRDGRRARPVRRHARSHRSLARALDDPGAAALERRARRAAGARRHRMQPARQGSARAAVERAPRRGGASPARAARVRSGLRRARRRADAGAGRRDAPRRAGRARLRSAAARAWRDDASRAGRRLATPRTSERPCSTRPRPG